MRVHMQSSSSSFCSAQAALCTCMHHVISLRPSQEEKGKIHACICSHILNPRHLSAKSVTQRSTKREKICFENFHSPDNEPQYPPPLINFFFFFNFFWPFCLYDSAADALARPSGSLSSLDTIRSHYC